MRAEPELSRSLEQDDEAHAMLSVVREDVRQTLRTAWLDPGLEAASQWPIFFTTAWSAIRPSVGRSFLVLAKALREQAVRAVLSPGGRRDLRQRLGGALTTEELERVTEAARAGHLAAPKSQIVQHLLLRAARRERTRGTGQEEPPSRRGVPEWQRWMSVLPTPDPSRPVLWQAKGAFGTPTSPGALRPFARWPDALEGLWEEMRDVVGTDDWRLASAVLRRTMVAGLPSLPHPVDLQWAVMRERGFAEEDRERLLESLEAYDAPSAGQTLAAAFAWVALGAPDLGAEA
jgi:hypothetical protein